jgi:predicted flavoprotein YhiN
VKAALLHEVLDPSQRNDVDTLANTIKRLPLNLKQARPLAEAISSAGGVRLEAMNESLMLTALPGVFCAGEMLDWEAPTGGYLLTACFASGYRAGRGAAAWLNASQARRLG